MNEIKKQFFTYRNGAVADTLRRYGMPHKVIFGLQVPQLAEIARNLSFDTEEERHGMAGRLWADREVRESRLLATYLFQPDRTDIGKAMELALDARTQEEADMLAFRLFRHLPYAGQLLDMLRKTPCSEAAKRAASSLASFL